MTTTYGLTPTGYLPKTQDICRAEIGAAIQQLRGLSVDISDGSLEGQFIGILSEREATIWDLLQAIYSSQDPDAATSTALDALCALTGTIRTSAKNSVVTETLTGVPATVVASGTQIKTLSTGALFATASSAAIASVPAWAPTTAYTVARSGAIVGQRVTNASRVYECITAGTSAGSGGPTTTALNITDGSVHWRYLGDGTGAVDVTTKSTIKGTIVAVSGDLTQIMTPVGGLQGASNVLDATVGAVVQQDAPLRLTRESELSQSGNSPADAIRAAVLEVTGVTTCTVFVNNTDVIDANGQAPHSVQVLVQGGADTAIATVLAANVAGGIVTIGTTTVTLPDSQGVNHNWNFTRPAATNIYVDITLTYNPATNAYGGDAAVQAAIAAFGNAFGIGKDVVASSLSAATFPLFTNGSVVVGVAGVLDVTSVKIGIAPAPGSSTTIVIDNFHIAAFDTSRVTVHSSAGSY